jgi:hypothetical protein
MLLAVSALALSVGSGQPEAATSQPSLEAVYRNAQGLAGLPAEAEGLCRDERSSDQFPCDFATSGLSEPDLAGLVSVHLAYRSIAGQPRGKTLRPAGEIAAAALVAAAGEAIDRVPQRASNLDEARRYKPRRYDLNNVARVGAAPSGALAALAVPIMDKLGSCTGALDRTLRRMQDQGSVADRLWAKRVRRDMGTALLPPDHGCLDKVRTGPAEAR